MTMNDDTPEPPIVTRTIAEAEAAVKHVTTLLQFAGWNAILVSVSRAIETAPGEYQAPGATATVIDSDCGPIVPMIVQVLRLQADALERGSKASKEEPTNGYIHDQTNYASGMREWPE